MASQYQKMRKILLSLWVLAFSISIGNAQILNPTHWSFEAGKKKVKAGETIDLVFKVKIDSKWHLYSNDFDSSIGPKPAKFFFKKAAGYELVGKVKPIGAHELYDEIFGGNVRQFENKAEFRQKVKILGSVGTISGSYESQTCSDEKGICVDQDGDFSFGPFELEGEPATAPNSSKPESISPSSPVENQSGMGLQSNGSDTTQFAPNPEETSIVQKSESPQVEPSLPKAPEVPNSLWKFFLAAFLSGLVALLTPCVFPMIPMTVSFFTRQSQSRAQAVGKALIYGFSIIVLYVLIGTIVSRLNGPEFANFVSTHWIPNVFFFLVFLLFGFSFLGMFEIVLPSSLVNLADRESDKGGLYGIFFMAFTIVLVSFSCTGPIVGSILVQSAGGEVLKPIVGMFGFSLAFALPFGLFAVFPQWLSSLPKSGGWLNSVKVVLGFIELAFALKFLSIADQAYHWHILDREVYLAFWIVIFSLIGFYLLGKIILSHDTKPEYISVQRLLLAIVTFAFVVYMIPGMWGAPLRFLSGYLPPETSLDFNLTKVSKAARRESQPSALCDWPNYSDKLHLPHQLEGYFDLKQALACAKQKNKPVFIDFTGHGCVNCREMEANVWSHPEVLKRLQNDFIVVALYVDDKTELPKDQWYVSKYDGREKKTIGKQNADLQVTRFQANAQPLYVLLSPEGELLNQPVAYNLDVNAFVRFLDEGKSKIKPL